eukprot:comp18971_c0_seq1/m.21269 comp18971_c0_seq1/g.21269  ORF comp18971_c0_seq1/g.21269 comp18971_c0_seq1/m.21269 type:complete len:262 (-) comp18971_c0_seq1:313-1098(-)
MYAVKVLGLACVLASALGAPSTHQRVSRGAHKIKSGATWANLAWEVKEDNANGKDVVLVDLLKTSESQVSKFQSQGSSVICYMSAGTVENWRPDARSFPSSVISEKSRYSGESWLDITRWEDFKDTMAARMDNAKSLGCDGLEADNLDCFLHDCVPGASTETLKNKQTEYARWLADAAHSRGMVIGLKNALEILRRLQGSFDFAINESCTRFNECYYYEPFQNANKAVFGVEYSAGSASCAQAKRYGISMKYKSSGDWKDC